MRRQCELRKVAIRAFVGDISPFRFDPEKIKQALLNITRNALEAMPEGGEISITTATEENNAVITISDNGPGICQEDLPLIFEPFFTRKGAGTGLGLSITQRIVEEHHGRILAMNNPGSGTTFTLKLPMKTDTERLLTAPPDVTGESLE
jgi:signal transduction histidine kinase